MWEIFSTNFSRPRDELWSTNEKVVARILTHPNCSYTVSCHKYIRHVVLFGVINQLLLLREEFRLSKLTFHSVLRRRAATRRALPRISSCFIVLLLCYQCRWIKDVQRCTQHALRFKFQKQLFYYFPCIKIYNTLIYRLHRESKRETPYFCLCINVDQLFHRRTHSWKFSTACSLTMCVATVPC